MKSSIIVPRALVAIAVMSVMASCAVVNSHNTGNATRLFGRRNPRVEVIPDSSFIDQPVKISLRDFPARQPVTLRLSMTNQARQVWQSEAEFLTDQKGNVNLATQAPISGTYRHADADGLLWSLSLEAGTNTNARKLPRASFKPGHLTFAASMNGRIIAAKTIERFLLYPGVGRIVVHDNGLCGTLFLPPGKGPHPGIIVLGGSEGGLPETEAAYLAAKGYAAFALAYFHYEDLPESVENIPLEYFETAIRWFQERPEIRRNEIAVLGGSRGAELALLLGATFPEIHAVVAIAPSSVLWGGLSTNIVPAWTLKGKPLQFMDGTSLTDEQQKEMTKISPTNLDYDVLWFQIQLENKVAVAKASIPVEKINGPVLLISGNDDKVWPSTEMAEQIMERLKRARHPFNDAHLTYSHVGHLIPFPNCPATITSMVHPITHEKLNFGGDPEYIAAAAVASWARILHFLNAELYNGRN